MPRRNLTIIFIAAFLSLICYGAASRNRFMRLFGESLDIISYQYVRPIDDETLFNSAMDGMTMELDQNSTYIPPTDFTDFREELDQEFGGIGIHVMYDEEKNQMLVVTPVSGTPAYQAGVQAGDVILAIDDVKVDDVGFEKSVKRLRGVVGTDVTLQVRHIGQTEPVDIVVERAQIQVASVLGDTHDEEGDWNFFLEEDPRIGYIRIDSFGDLTADEFLIAWESIDGKVDGLIVDLRNNPGGYLTAAEEICDMFLDKGVIVSTRGRNGRIEDIAEASSAGTIIPKDLPVAVLLNQYSASASEIVAACLQDHDRAVIIGQRSWGKGTVQSIFPLDRQQRALKITTATYWRPSEQNIHRFPDFTDEDSWGVSPNEGYAVPLADEELKNMLRSRSFRDVDRSNIADQAAIDAREKSDEEIELEDFVDPQLQKAVEYIQSRLKDSVALR
ncbi:S41 family peptidase [Blastopirellula retiformator]|uniref:Carboxy-terminal processing protease CtpB n=1 Tax=Blastopirellula retiformator TaxID=2527970 RepID=A0A5C5UX30_9BACT|nr:S41 family peptidase [Blastopirellula retiformator]TWT30748.1 Carboxy-terminal processing protease CtpB precursor [Blastopirellula retiformator]